MAKNVVFCADGTWNGPSERTGLSVTEADDTDDEVAEADGTNVLKLFTNLAGVSTETSRREHEKVLRDDAGAVRQVVKYLHGVGDSDNRVKKALGGAFGFGVIARIVRGYTFISRWYRPGDAITLCGFSRGAYTARALAGMIAKVGLLDPATYDPLDRSEAYRLGAAAWAKSKAIALEGAGFLNAVAAFVLDAVQSAIALPLSERNLIADVPLKAVAVWDTVGSLGIPKYVNDRRYDLFRFVDNELSPKVAFGLHAMAIDEQRIDFPVTRWQPRAGVQEVWFVGAHADVGGGYRADESGLSDAALGWMLRKLADLDLVLLDPLPALPHPRVVDAAIHEPWKAFPFDQLPRGPRLVARADTVHASVMQRWNAGYRPAALDLAGTGVPAWVVDATTI